MSLVRRGGRIAGIARRRRESAVTDDGRCRRRLEWTSRLEIATGRRAVNSVVHRSPISEAALCGKLLTESWCEGLDGKDYRDRRWVDFRAVRPDFPRRGGTLRWSGEGGQRWPSLPDFVRV